jgi:hypothetical protein
VRGTDQDGVVDGDGPGEFVLRESRFIEISVLSVMLKTGPQRRSKIVGRGRVIRMGWKPEFESLSEKRNCFVDIILLIFFFKSGQQSVYQKCQVACESGVILLNPKP